MINNIPFFRFPFSHYSSFYHQNPYNRFYSKKFNKQNSYTSNTSTNSEIGKLEIISDRNKKNLYKNKSSKYYSFGPIFFNTDFFSNNQEPVLKIYGLTIYLDDLIILSLLFFLYQENVKDEILFILLILLLIS